MWRRLFRGRTPPRETQVVLYTRLGCHLCDDARVILNAARRRHSFELSAFDIDRETELAARYGECVPVVTVNGKVRFRGRVSAALLERLLRAEAARAQDGGGDSASGTSGAGGGVG